VKRILIALILILCVLMSGTIGYMLLENWNILDALYMTIITISTVGFHEVSELDFQGRIFTIILIILGIGIGSYTIGNLSAFLIEGHIRNILKGKIMEKEIAALKDHIIICGFGRTGENIVETLLSRKNKFVIIEKDEARVQEAIGKKFLIIQGDATDDEILQKSGVDNAYSLITTLGNDADNVYVVLTSRGINSKLRIIARAVDEISMKKLFRAGADKVVSPFSIAGKRMAYLATNPDIVEFLEVMSQSDEFELKMEQVVVNKKSQLIDKKLNQSNIKSETNGAMVIGIKKALNGKMIVNPPGEILLEDGDILIALGNELQIDKLKEMAEKKRILDIT